MRKLGKQQQKMLQQYNAETTRVCNHGNAVGTRICTLYGYGRHQSTWHSIHEMMKLARRPTMQFQCIQRRGFAPRQAHCPFTWDVRYCHQTLDGLQNTHWQHLWWQLMRCGVAKYRVSEQEDIGEHERASVFVNEIVYSKRSTFEVERVSAFTTPHSLV